ncbi:iron ABC transporter permease [Pseudonocardia petroleophila]|uniref:Iron ABC transporter permease n=1 Tax=Pseudonocardia petroleophila TaxID=37331 RepID=A0A7G7MJ50_9PSEU|nr:iron ABC transporter permease [Pseudonocardia petroleophila]QNG52811.1 iron ABC transporter permease [Pseudonocardia petroleophila]
MSPAVLPAADDLGRATRRRRTAAWTGGLGTLLVLSVPLAVGLGPVAIPPGTVAAVLGHHLVGFPGDAAWGPAQDSIVWLVRAPRVLLGAVVGAALAMAGVALQTLVRNVLAEPYLLGVSAGASTGAAATILFGVGSALGGGALTGSAFLGALGAIGLVFAVAGLGGAVTSVRLLLAGVAVGYVLQAVTSFMIFASDSPEGARAVLFWLLGSLARADWAAVAVVAPTTAVTLALLLAWSRRFDALAVGDDTARALGTDPARLRLGALLAVALCTGAAVAVSGGIGFVGLVVPHVARLCVGGAHRRVLPVAALIGAAFLIWADVVARLAFAPRELPLGIVTAVVGAPFLLVLVRRLRAA